MSGLVSPLTSPGRVTAPRPASASPLPPLDLPALRDLETAAAPRLSIALMDDRGRLQDRGAVTTLGWQPGDRLLITLIRTSVLIRRRADGVSILRRPYIALPAPVLRECGARPGSRLLLVTDPAQQVLRIHPETAVQAMLRTFHTALTTTEEAS